MNKLKEIRTDQLITQEELASITGLSKTTISLIENQYHDPILITKKKLAKALKVDVKGIFPEDLK